MEMKNLGMFVLAAVVVLSVISPVSAWWNADGKNVYIVTGTQNPSASGIAMDTVGSLDISAANTYRYRGVGMTWAAMTAGNSWWGLVDSEVTGPIKYNNNVNLIVIAGPVANAVTQDLVARGKCTINWSTSPGETQYIPDAWGTATADVWVVGGKDRWATRKACHDAANDWYQ